MARLLVVDDDEPTAAAIQRILERAGHIVTVALDGLEAEHPLQGDSANDRFDLVLTDISMPRKNGLELLVSLRRNSALPRPRVIAISGARLGGSWSALTIAKGLGADAILEKPFREMELVHHIEKQLASAVVGPPEPRRGSRGRRATRHRSARLPSGLAPCCVLRRGAPIASVNTAPSSSGCR